MPQISNQPNKIEQWRRLQLAADMVDNGKVADATAILEALKVPYDPSNISESISQAIKVLGLGSIFVQGKGD